ncbi:hypothetical protein BAUCODRAFT_276548 [Baudoinia panamericana UAMH 10762]|uniref:Methyltransferase domain-containing protein n=1 Tax=Baudoinia panamericana (strain UAMH 10762) TaxID=717646 RepID=M2MZM1_BAUPA|nr:uncharacterized protein BAUCODRAFT_276548 [Baudoinia panamericana UAMH 10762]EMC92114.1 hypothetical protein BAUCODRAFT_276548 [Baudoinia panamericana UAMH 10762]
MSENPERAQLREHFLDKPFEQHAKGWDDLWKKSFTPWDRDKPSPALVDTLNQKGDILGGALMQNGEQSQQKSRKRAFVPGCGRGYDVLLLASYGYDAYGLDVSETALEKANQLVNDPSLVTTYPVRDGDVGRGSSKFVKADFFADGFLSETGGGSFDLIYDYTFLCALPLDMRPRWAKRMSELLSPEGHLVCLEFPLGKALSTGGPPHGVQRELYEQLLHHPGREVSYDQSGNVSEDKSDDKATDALVRVDRWMAERTHAIGQGKDHVSIWRHVEVR